jgi:hypothetical protein
MVTDYYTKPLQGDLFYKFRDQIMGLVLKDTIIGDHRSVLDNNLEGQGFGFGFKSHSLDQLSKIGSGTAVETPRSKRLTKSKEVS